MQDEQRVHFLVGVPSFEVDKYERFTMKISTSEERPRLTAREVFEDKSALVYCKL